MRKIIVLVSMLLPAAVLAQAPAPAQAPKETPAAASAGAGRVAVVDFQKAVIENAEGKKAQEKFMAEVNKRRSEEHTSELQTPYDLVCRLLLEKKKKKKREY